MKKLQLVTKLPIIVPTSLIDALWKMYERYNQEFGETTQIAKNGKEDAIFVTEFQVPENKRLLEVATEKTTPSLQLLKHRTEWLFYDEHVKVVDEFVKQNFTSAWQFRIDKLPIGRKLAWHNKHPFPRVFIPMHENTSHFRIKRGAEYHDNIYNLGECWMWDVREWHEVDNTEGSCDRIMACFNIDPAIEQNQHVFY
jgi:hypothetical protein